ncbi:hypothetical protein OHC33_010369 [Knufia fluminis]|uniref:Uncharacterized protein n=1 Tax=Knufia fluminis TaxID=191047 RepID=A0AAN8E9P4_9EURO|nr:hypothetical protein OHC33_010369 [Knufia fluminis]
MRWWDAAQKLSGHDQPAQYWTRPSAQLFAFQNTGHNNPLQLWEHQDMIDFRPHCMFSQIPDGGDRNPFSTIPVQWEDGYEVGSKYVHTIQAHIPGQGGDNEKAKDAEKEAAKQAENARKYRDELRKEGKPVRW